MMQLVVPSLEYLPSYAEALKRSWAPNNLRPESAQEELAKIEINSQAFLDWLDSRGTQGEMIPTPSGELIPRLPGYRMWMWDGEFCGSIGFRWQERDGLTVNDLPDYCLGHIGYSVVPWKQRLGYATQALAQMLPLVRQQGIQTLLITTEPSNRASQRVIEANGGQFVKAVTPPEFYGHTEQWIYQIVLY
jgi:predicted acetyltransferase